MLSNIPTLTTQAVVTEIVRTLEAAHTGMCYGDEKRGSVSEFTRGFGACIAGLKRILGNGASAIAAVPEPDVPSFVQKWTAAAKTLPTGELKTETRAEAFDRETLELVVRCNPSLPLHYLKENTAFDASLFQKMLEMAQEYARAAMSEQKQAEPAGDEGAAFSAATRAAEFHNAGDASGWLGVARYAWLAALEFAAQSGQQARVEDTVATKYFVYSDDTGLDEYETDAERANAHTDAIQSYLDCGSDGWSEQVTSVVSGVITHVTTKSRSVPNPEHTGDCDCAGCEEYREAGGTNEYCEICDYQATPVAAAPTQQEMQP